MGGQGRFPGWGRRVRAAAVVALAAAVTATGVLVGTAGAQAEDYPKVAGTVCTSATRACVDLAGRRAWLFDRGQVVRGPLRISSGGPGQETPRGVFQVEWKNKDHRTSEFNNAPMPFAVFFAPGGIAFHEGSVESTSAGCVRMARADASAFYDFLAVGDVIEVR